MRLRPSSRRGAALIIVLVMLTMIATGTAVVAWNGVAARRHLNRRENALQAEWLARGGVELAHARASRKESLPAEWRPLGERAIVRIGISEKEGRTTIVAEATYPADESQPAVREAAFAIGPVDRK